MTWQSHDKMTKRSVSVILPGRRETSLSVFFNHFSLSKAKVHICMSITVEADIRDNMREVEKKISQRRKCNHFLYDSRLIAVAL